MQQKPMHILVCPLDWGLGHAARCIPVINKLLEAGHRVTLAGHGRSLILLKKEYPQLESIELKGFSPSYSRSGNIILHLFLRLPQFLGSILHEHHELKTLIPKHQFDIVISDNRYGLWNKNVMSILITHQVMIKLPAKVKFLEYFLFRISRCMISRFDECWIPDDKESPGLSGDLSHHYSMPENAKFIGPLSRFHDPETSSVVEKPRIKIIAILSGPEPQRSIFEQMVIMQLSEMNLKALLIGGKPETEQVATANKNLSILPYMTTAELRAAIETSELVICRSGYSSIMDLQAIEAKALFVPTPGQTEQIYLATLHGQSGTAFWCKQEKLNLKKDIAEALKFPGFKPKRIGNELWNAIADLKKK